MTFAEAAALPLGGLNALHFMRLANVGQDEQVLVNGAGGSIGSYAVQIAKAMGAHVTAVDRGDKESGVRALGADDFIDYMARDFTRDKGRYDVVFDMVPDSSYSGCIGVLKPDGRYLCGNPRLLSMLRCTLTNRYTRRTARFRFAAEDRAGLQSLAGLAETGRIGSIVDTVYPLDQVVAAHRRVETEQRVGAIVLDVHRGGEI
jgi:NADPH:quinone reductase-like Zn-dependent oxidoreductase